MARDGPSLRGLGRRKKTGMNISIRMLPGLVLLLAGAGMTLASGKVARVPEREPAVKIAGVLVCALGALLVFVR